MGRVLCSRERSGNHPPSRGAPAAVCSGDTVGLGAAASACALARADARLRAVVDADWVGCVAAVGAHAASRVAAMLAAGESRSKRRRLKRWSSCTDCFSADTQPVLRSAHGRSLIYPGGAETLRTSLPASTPRRRTRSRAGAVRGLISALSRTRPRGHHRGTGRAAQHSSGVAPLGTVIVIAVTRPPAQPRRSIGCSARMPCGWAASTTRSRLSARTPASSPSLGLLDATGRGRAGRRGQRGQPAQRQGVFHRRVGGLGEPGAMPALDGAR